MENQKLQDRELLARHIVALQAAGIDWLPKLLPLLAGKKQIKMEVNDEVKKECQLPNNAPANSLSERTQALTLLKDEVSGCSLCKPLALSRTQTVFGIGKLDPEICFVGEAPGATEDLKGEPFIGDAGQLFDKIILACGLKREDLYICNILRCRPPGNRMPLPDEAANCRPFLEKQLRLVKPRVICCLGACAAQNLLKSTVPIGMLRGQVFQWEGIPVFCTYHPAYLLRIPQKKREVWEDMKQILAFLGKPIPQN